MLLAKNLRKVSLCDEIHKINCIESLTSTAISLVQLIDEEPNRPITQSFDNDPIEDVFDVFNNTSRFRPTVPGFIKAIPVIASLINNDMFDRAYNALSQMRKDELKRDATGPPEGAVHLGRGCSTEDSAASATTIL